MIGVIVAAVFATSIAMMWYGYALPSLYASQRLYDAGVAVFLGACVFIAAAGLLALLSGGVLL